MIDNFLFKIKLFKNYYFNIYVLLVSLILSFMIILLINNYQNSKTNKQTYEFLFQIDKSIFSHTDVIYQKYFGSFYDSEEWKNSIKKFQDSRAKFEYYKDINKRFSFNQDARVHFLLDTEINKMFFTDLKEIFFATRIYVDKFFYIELNNFNDENIIQNFFVDKDLDDEDKIIFRYLMDNYVITEHTLYNENVLITFKIETEDRDSSFYISSRNLLHSFINYYFDQKYILNTAPIFSSNFKNNLKKLKNNIHIMREKSLIYRLLDYENYLKCLEEQLNIAVRIDHSVPEYSNLLNYEIQKYAFAERNVLSLEPIYYCKGSYYLLGTTFLRKLKQESLILKPEYYLKDFLSSLEIFENSIENIKNVIANFQVNLNLINENPNIIKFYRADLYHKSSKMNFFTKVLFFIINSFLFFYVFFIVKNYISHKKK